MTGADKTARPSTKKSAIYLQNLFLQLLYRKVMGWLWILFKKMCAKQRPRPFYLNLSKKAF